MSLRKKIHKSPGIGYIPWAEDLVPEPGTMENIKKNLEIIDKLLNKNEIKMKRKSIYFAHPFERMDTKREEMIEKILTERGFIVVNPFDEEIKICKKYGVLYYYDNPTEPFAYEIVDKDYKMIEACDELFAWISKGDNAVGTTWEIRWAKDLGKKVTVLISKPHPFIWRFVDKIYIGYYNFTEDIPFYEKTD